jgi:hypothetical protein
VHPQIEDADVSLASIGLSLFILEHLSEPSDLTDPCPLLLPDQVGYFMGQQGLAPTQNGYSVSLFREEDTVAEGATGVQCGVDIEASAANPDPAAPHAVLLDAFSTGTGEVTIQTLADSYGAPVLGPGAADVGGELTGFCGAISGQPVCLLGWLRDPLVVEIGIGGPGITLGNTTAVFNAMLPSIVESLVNFEPNSLPTTIATPAPTDVATTVAAATTVPAPPSTAVAPTSAAAATTVAATAVASTLPTPSLAPVTVATTATVPTTAFPSTVPASSAPTPTVTAGQLDTAAAKATLGTFLAANPIGTEVVAGPGVVPPCPALGPEPMATAMQQLGLQPNLDPFTVAVLERTDWAAGLAYVTCGANTGGAAAGIPDGVAPHFASVDFYDITGAFTWEQVVATLPGSTPIEDPTTGGQITGGCVDLEATFCARLWHRDGLIVRLSLVAPAGQIDETVTTNLLLALVPQAVTDLATNAYWPPPAS